MTVAGLSEPVRFLHALGQALATSNLYSGEHPARAKAAEGLYNELQALLEITPRPRFSFLGDEVIYGKMAIRGLKDWTLSSRLSRGGIQWLEFDESCAREDIRGFIEDVSAVLASPADVPVDPLLFQRSGIRWGTVSIKDPAPGGGSNGVARKGGGGGAAGLEEEMEAVRWIRTALDGGHAMPLGEAQAIVRSLVVAMHQDHDILTPLLSVSSTSDRDSSHALGVATLAMTLAEHLRMDSRQVRAAGTAGLLHDIGLSKVSREILSKDTALTPEERAEYERHTEYGARILLQAERELSLAAIVAYEHHLRPDGKGFPRLRFNREPHVISRMIRICASYNARRTDFPGRPGMDGTAVLKHIEWNAGTKYDAELATQFVGMLRAAEEKLQKGRADRTA